MQGVLMTLSPRAELKGPMVTRTPRSKTTRPGANGSASSRSARKASAANAQKRNTQTTRRSTRATRKVDPPESSPGVFKYLFDGHGHDVWGIVLIIAAILIGVGVYTTSAGPLGSGLNSFTSGLFGVLRFLLPIGLIWTGIILIRGPRDVNDAEAEQPDTEIEFDENGEPLSTTVRSQPLALRILGIVMAALIVAGVLDLLLAEGVSIEADGLIAYAPGGGLIGGFVGGLALLIGRWAALAVLLVLGIFAISLITGYSLRTMAQATGRALSPLMKLLGQWLTSLFRIGDDTAADEDDDTEDYPGLSDYADDDADDASASGVELFDQDAGAAAPAKPKRGSKKKKPEVIIPEAEAFNPDGEVTHLQMDFGPMSEPSQWRLPPKKLLPVSQKQRVDTQKVRERGEVLERSLAEHGVETRLVNMVVGPTVTRYELELGVGVKVARVTSLNKDIAYAMATPDVRILAPIPGRQAIGVEVPNEKRQVVALGDILNSREAHEATHPLEVAVGRGISGESVMMNLATMPHLLIAGQTGAGKSSCINSIITSILMRATPKHVRMILIDPKQVELTQYNRIPHLLTQVVTNPKKAANALTWAVAEMERRYDLLSEIGVRDITGYNAAYERGDLLEQFGPDRDLQRLPFILIVVDELADLMMVASRDVEESITRIAAKARAVGIHLVIATQRPSVNVITGVIKANIPARLAFAVSSATDSKVILDQTGADRLVGQGDMLLLGGNTSVAQRIQGAWVEESEVLSIVKEWRKQTPAPEEHYVKGVADEEIKSSNANGLGGGGGSGDGDDMLVRQALELVVRSKMGSTSMLQRKLKVGFARAGRLMDELEERGIVGPSEGSKAREVLMTPDELDELIEQGEL